MSNKKAIIGINIKNGGMKGLEINYCQQDEKDGKVWNNEYWTARKVPVGEELENVIKAFRYYLLDILGYEMENANVADCIINEINFPGSIEIKGEKKVLNGTHYVKAPTGKIDDSHEYEKMEELRNLVGQLKKEIEKYMEGKSIMGERQFVMKFYEGKKGFDEAEFAGLSDADLKVKYTEALEKLGSIVIHEEDMGEATIVAEEDVPQGNPPQKMISEATTSEEVTEGITTESAVIVPNFESVMVVEDEKTPELVVGLEEDGDDFALAIAPVKSM